MDANADEKRQANGQAQRDAGRAKRPNEPARKRNKEHQGGGDPAVVPSEIAEEQRHGGEHHIERHGCQAAAIRAAHVHHGGVQGADHDEVGQRSHAQCGKDYERKARGDRAPQGPDERNPIGTGRELASELLKGRPHAESEKGNRWRPVRVSAVGGDAWVRISRFRRLWTAYYAGVARVLVSAKLNASGSQGRDHQRWLVRSLTGTRIERT